MEDLTIGLKRYRDAIRWKEHFLGNKSGTNEETTKDLTSSRNSTTSNEFIRKIGLNTSVKPLNKSKKAPIGSPALETYFKETD